MFYKKGRYEAPAVNIFSVLGQNTILKLKQININIMIILLIENKLIICALGNLHYKIL